MDNYSEDEKLIKCKYCRKLISKDARICPNCKKTTFYGKFRKVLFIILVYLFLMFLAFH